MSSWRDGRPNSRTNSGVSSASSTARRSAANILRINRSGTTAARNSQASTGSEGERSSGNTFFRNFFAQRNNDYRADVPTPIHSQGTAVSRATTATAARATGRASPPPESTSEHEEVPTPSCCDCLRPSPGFLSVLSTIIGSRLWRIIILFNTFLLLFGSEIQEIWIPAAGDVVMDVLYCIAFGVFTMDMIMRCYLEPKYISRPRIRSKESAQNKAWGRCQLGSFLFWCDLLSTLTLLYNITFINTQAFEMQKLNIKLNYMGIPVAGLDEVNKAVPLSANYDILILIGRTARAARFIQRITFKRSNIKYNAYWFVTRLNPLWYVDQYHQKRRSSRSLSFGKSSDMNSSSNNLGSATGRQQRSTSWGDLQMAIMAKTRSYPSSEPEKPRGIKGVTVHALRKMGLMRNNRHEEFRRHVAATKIQRAWRATVAQNSDADARNDVAWMGQRSSVRSMSPPHNKKKHLWERRRAPDIPKVSGKGSVRTSSSGRRTESQVGSAMRELTAQRVALGIIIALVLTVIFTYTEQDATRPSAMIVLHNQTGNDEYAEASLEAARNSSIPDLFRYQFENGTVVNFTVPESKDPENLRPREKIQISVEKGDRNPDATGADDLNYGNSTIGWFAFREERVSQSWVEICTTLFILCVWLFGVVAFAGPVMTLVVIPIERMVRLLGMLMMDPLGYQSTSRYKKFLAEENEVTQHTQWTKDQLKGMETSFLMSTILRIGSLMKVGFGSAGVEIIRNNLETGQSKNMLILNSQGSTVSCIFLFCDIRQFTDATECLQEEVFVFTNRIAGVVHSIVHSYGGSANKNIGDAFLVSWLLDEGAPSDVKSSGYQNQESFDDFSAKHSQADKALLSVVKISIALQHDQYYLEPLSEGAREALLTKLSKRKGPVVQLGFGLHAGSAVQGAIGSQRKIDATYVSESVERAEFLESSTKKYGVRMLMSDSFHRLLHPSNRRRCRKIDQILLQGEDDEDEDAPVDEGNFMELFTFDMDIDALWRPVPVPKTTPAATTGVEDHISDSESVSSHTKNSKRDLLRSPSARGAGLLNLPRRRSVRLQKPAKGDESNDEHGTTPTDAAAAAAAVVTGTINAGANVVAGGGTVEPVEEVVVNPPELVLPTGPALYNANVWLSDDMRRIRQLYSDGLFFQKFNSGFLAYYAKDWGHATQCFQTILERFDDGPSRYFLKCMKDCNGEPPRDFKPYGLA